MTPQDRLARREANPALVRLSHALSRLNSVLTVMNTGAHPDDEHSGLLAWLRFGKGMRVVIACSTRGEGGQNALGPERHGLLGAIRTREMEEAARVLDCDVAWLGFGPTDRVHDFGFSKDGDDTFARWDKALITRRLAVAYRKYRPDVVLPTFLDVPGQHGHHRAMTRAAYEAIALAADPDALRDCPYAPWQVTHHYLPAWSGGGATYDDAMPPPPATLKIIAAPVDPATGAAFSEIGQWSRRRHASQGMGSWSDNPASSWDLHRVGGEAEAGLAQSLPQDLNALSRLAGPAADAIQQAAAAVTRAQDAFPDRQRIMIALADADKALGSALQTATAHFLAAHGHRIRRKQREIAMALGEAAGLSLIATPDPASIPPDGAGTLSVTQTTPIKASDVTLVPRLPQGVGAPTAALGTTRIELPVTVTPDAAYSSAFRESFDPLGGNGSCWLEVSATIAGRRVDIKVDLETPLAIVPRHSFDARPAEFIRKSGEPAAMVATLADDTPLGFSVPDGWAVEQQGRILTVTPPTAAVRPLTVLTPTIQDHDAQTISRADYPHIGTDSYSEPAALKVLSMDLVLPKAAKIAYIGTGDNVGLWMQRLGLDVSVLDRLRPDEDFSTYTTVVIGVVAFGGRPDLVEATPKLHRFVSDGGHLLTLYQRPDLGWMSQSTPPLMLRVGTPSLRWRVTDPAANVTMLDAEHPLLGGPNRITAADFDGWDKERGLYFAAEWDPAYQPLLAMSDRGEAPLNGALLSAVIGKGRHTHTGLVLHHQLDKLVPGAFRLLANLVQPVT